MGKDMRMGQEPVNSINSVAFLITVLSGNGCIDVINNGAVDIKKKYGIDGVKAYPHSTFIEDPNRKKIEREMYDELRSEKDLRAWGLIEKHYRNLLSTSL